MNARFATIALLTSLMVLMHTIPTALAFTITLELQDSYILSYRATDIPLVYGITSSCLSGTLGFSTYGTTWINGTESVSITSPHPSKFYLFFTRKSAEPYARAYSIFNGMLADYGRVTIGYVVDEKKVVRVFIACDDCSFSKKWYLAYGTTTLVIRNEGLTKNVTKIDIQII